MRKIFTKETHIKIQEIKAAMKLQKAYRLYKRRKFQYILLITLTFSIGKYLSHYRRSKPKKIDHYYDPILDSKLQEYEDKVKSRCRTFTMAELGDQTEEELEREFISKYRNFYDNYIDNELTRRKANWLCDQIDEMMPFLSEEGKVDKIRIWGYDGSTPSIYLDARKTNEKKIETAMSGQLFLHEDDDLDIEGDRLLREIRDFKKEMISNHFY